MSKQTIAILYIIGIIIEFIAIIIFFACMSGYNNAAAKYESYISFGACNNAVGSYDCETARASMSESQGGMIAALIFMGLAGILSMIAWIGTLVNLSRAQAWAWFVLTFFFGGIMILIYLVGGPQHRQTGYSPQGQPGSLAAPSSSFGISPQAYEPPPSLSALEILQQRYARGEIDTPTFQQMREML